MSIAFFHRLLIKLMTGCRSYNSDGHVVIVEQTLCERGEDGVVVVSHVHHDNKIFLLDVDKYFLCCSVG